MSDKPQKSNIFKIVIIVLLSLVVVGGAAFGGMYIAGRGGSSAKETKTKEIVEVTYSLDEFLVNLLDEEGRRYLKVNVYIGYEENENLSKELGTKKPIIRDVVNASLRSKKSTDFTDIGVERIKNELIANVNPVLTKGKISNIYFHDILVQ